MPNFGRGMASCGASLSNTASPIWVANFEVFSLPHGHSVDRFGIGTVHTPGRREGRLRMIWEQG